MSHVVGLLVCGLDSLLGLFTHAIFPMRAAFSVVSGHISTMLGPGIGSPLLQYNPARIVYSSSGH